MGLNPIICHTFTLRKLTTINAEDYKLWTELALKDVVFITLQSRLLNIVYPTNKFRIYIVNSRK